MRATSAGSYQSGLANTLVVFLFTVGVIAAGAFSLFKLSTSGTPAELVKKDTPPAEVMNVLKALPQSERDQIALKLESELRANPLDLSPLLKLAALAAASGDQKKSDALTLEAAGRSYQDAGLQASALQIELKQRNFAAATTRIDVLLRTTPEISDELYKTLGALAQNQDSQKFVVDSLAKKPSWRTPLLAKLAAEPSFPVNTLYEIFTQLRALQSPESSDELRAILARLTKAKDFEKAYFIWVDSLSEVELRKVGLIYDGGFDLPASNQFFSWTIFEGQNVETRIVPRAPGSTDLVLRVDFASAKTNYNHFQQFLRLQPGSYRMSGEAKADNLVTSNGLQWTVYCISGSPLKIGESARLKGTQPWTRSSFNFEVPATDCSIQRLLLVLDAPTRLDQQISGSASYDSLLIEPLTPNSGEQ